jgi:putative YphP/YqiW family bacilliredoxin
MPYNPALVAPMRQEMTKMGARELTTAADVDTTLGDQRGTMLVFVNSVCGRAMRARRSGSRCSTASSRERS